MAIHVILEFDSREDAIEALGSLEARHIVEWFDDKDLKADHEEAAQEAFEAHAAQLRSA